MNIKQRRHALASALSASQQVGLIQARGHKVSKVKQLPLVLDDEVGRVSKTKQAVQLLKQFGLYEDVERVIGARQSRPGYRKRRNMKYKKRKGPLFIVDDGAVSLARALRNIPGVDVTNVSRLNLLQLAPGGVVGRLCVFTESALRDLYPQFGSLKSSAVKRKGYLMQRGLLTNQISKSVLHSDVVQKLFRSKQELLKTRMEQELLRKQFPRQKRNPFRN